MRFNYLFRGLVVCLALFVISASAAKRDSVAVAHVIYDGNSLYYADNESNLKYKALTKGDDGMFSIKFSNERLADGKKDVRQLRFGLVCSNGTCKTDLNELNRPYLAELFPAYDYPSNINDDDLALKPVLEVWIVINEDGTISTYDSKPNIQIVVPGKKTIRFLAPWTNTSAIMFMGSNEYYMTPVGSPYCGWFESKILLDPKDVFVSFKQTIGENYIGKDGLENNPISVENEIKLDSVLQLSDTVWITSIMYSSPDLYTEFPDELGECPIKNLPVMVFDWLHGSGNDEENTASQSGTSQDFGTGGCVGPDNAYKALTGMVEVDLGPNGVPVPAANFPSNCKTTNHLANWFLPEDLAKDNMGNVYTNATCRDLELVLDDEGFWLGQEDIDSPTKGMFLLDDFQYLDSAKTILNPYYDNIKTDLGTHNYGFTMKIQAQFEYVPGQEFEFFGDDDVWVFINNKLVVDIGGQHHRVNGKVKLDTIGKGGGEALVPGQTYPFHIFYAERHQKESNFKMRTSIDLKTDASMFFMDLSPDTTTIVKEVWQKVRERKLACDFSSSPETETTELGPSNFVLMGKGVAKGGVPLTVLDSLYYNGISITGDFTKITIDQKAIAKAQSLPPGTYYVRVSLKSNPKEFKDITFTVAPYELPNLAYASVKDSAYCVLNFIDDSEDAADSLCFTQFWNPYGNEISRNVSSDTLPINLDKSEKMWAGRSYPVNIMYAEDWAIMYSGIPVSIKTSTPNLVACDSLGNVIDEVLLTGGHASFFVKALDEVVNGTLTIKSAGAKNVSVDWTNINMAVPPVPQVDTAYIYDRNGDGRGDSLWLHFKKPLGGQSVLDSLKFVFGSNFDTPYKANYKDGDVVATVVADGDGFGTAIFTGGATDVYHGKVTVFYTYTDDEGKVSYFPVEGDLHDRIGPVIIAAEVEYMSDGNTLLRLSFSEGLNSANASSSMFSFICWRDNAMETNIKEAGDIGTTPANQWGLVFTKGGLKDVVPAVGDSVRFTPPSLGGQALDLVNAVPHEDNPWVRITGEQKVTVTSPKVVTLSPESANFDSAAAIIRSETATVTKLVTSEQTLSAEQVGAIYGTQGHYLGDLDMAQLVENEIAEIVKAVQGTPAYVDKNDPAVNGSDGSAGSIGPNGLPIGAKTYTIEDIITAVSTGKMTIDEAQDRFGLSDVIVDAYENGLLTKENLVYYSRGTDADIKHIVSAVADKTVLTYQTYYYTSLGHYVNGESGTITCNDDIFKADGKSNCLDSEGKLFLAWNMRAENGKLAATGVYIARLEVKITVNTKVITDRTQDFLWGVRRGKVNAIDLGL